MWNSEGVDDLDTEGNEGVNDLEDDLAEWECCGSWGLSSELPSEGSESDINPEWYATFRPIEGFSFNLWSMRLRNLVRG